MAGDDTPHPPECPDAFRPGRIGEVVLHNRIIKAGCFEGMCPDGSCTEDLIRHHADIAAGGAAMTTVAYCSVSRQGVAYGHEMWMRPELVPDLRRLTDAVHARGAAACIQLGHCGYFASKADTGLQPVGPSHRFNLFRLSFPRVMSHADIAAAVQQFVAAACLAREAGFDAVEVHAGHGYLLSQFLSPYTNRRHDAYGGSLENRVRFPAEVIRAVRSALGPGYPILVKMNVTDGIRGGLELEDAARVARRFEREGASALVPSCDFTSKTPLMMLRGNVPTREMVAVQRGWLKRVGLLLFGSLMVQEYLFRPLFLLEEASAIRRAVTIPVVLIGGVCSAHDVQRALEEGFEFVQIGRALIKDAAIVNAWARGEDVASDCDHCNRCIPEMDRGGVNCPCAERGPLRSRRRSRPREADYRAPVLPSMRWRRASNGCR